MKIVRVAAMIILSLILAGCAASPASPVSPASQEKVTLITGDYGYEVGDIVLIETQKEPQLGDVVQYDAGINRSFCAAFGPGVYLAKIVALPSDRVVFTKDSYEVNGRVYASEYRFYMDNQLHRRPQEMVRVMWGADRYENMAGMELEVPKGEYLADRWIGRECPPGEYDKHGSSIFYNRFTVKREAIKGILLKTLGHDKEFAEKVKRRVY